jgi:hypothetical protein
VTPPGSRALAVDRQGRIIGATVVGPRAAETLAELTLAVRMRLRTRDIARTIHPYPTYSDGPWNAAIDDALRALTSPTMQRAIRVLIRLRRIGAEPGDTTDTDPKRRAQFDALPRDVIRGTIDAVGFEQL